jgi:hypothetical protein
LAVSLPERVTARIYWFSTSARPSLIWRISIRIDCMTSKRLEPRDDHGLREFLGEELVWLRADDDGDMGGAEEAVDLHAFHRAQLRRFEDVGDRRRRQDMVAEDGKVGQALRLRDLQRDRGGGCRRLEADGEENDLFFGVCPGKFKRVHGRGDHADIRALGPRLQQRLLLRPRHPQHVAIGAERHALFLRQPDRHVQAAHRQHADGAARTVDHPHLRRQEVGHAIAEDRVGMPAAELHQTVFAVGRTSAAISGGEPAGQRLVAEIVHVFHGVAPISSSSLSVSAASA